MNSFAICPVTRDAGMTGTLIVVGRQNKYIKQKSWRVAVPASFNTRLDSLRRHGSQDRFARWPQRPSLGATALTGLVPVAFQHVPGQHLGVMTWYRPGRAGNETMEHFPAEGV